MSEDQLRQCLSDLCETLSADERLFSLVSTAQILLVLDDAATRFARSLDEPAKQLLSNMKRTASRYRGAGGRQSAKAMDDALKMKFLKELMQAVAGAALNLQMSLTSPPMPPPLVAPFVAGPMPGAGVGPPVGPPFPNGLLDGGMLAHGPPLMYPPLPGPPLLPHEAEHGGHRERRGEREDGGRRGGGRGARGRGGHATAHRGPGLLETPSYGPAYGLAEPPAGYEQAPPPSADAAAIAIANAAASGSSTGPPPPPRALGPLPAALIERLEAELAGLLAAEAPAAEAAGHVHRVATAVGEVVRGVAAGAGVRVVGSAGSGLHWRASDLNLLVEAPHAPAASAPTAAELLHQIAGALKTRPHIAAGLAVKSPHGGQRPHITFRHPDSGVKVELAVCSAEVAAAAVQSTSLLAAYARADGRLWRLATVCKLWATRHNFAGDLSHYACTLMAVNFLQSVTPPVLPNLQGASAVAAAASPTASGPPPAFNADPASVPGFTAGANAEPLAALFLQFLAFYGFLFSPETDAVSVRLGRPSRKIQTRCSSWSLWRVCVEEPFAAADAARTLRLAASQQAIFQALRASYEALCRGAPLTAAIPPPLAPSAREGREGGPSPQTSSRSLKGPAQEPRHGPGPASARSGQRDKGSAAQGAPQQPRRPRPASAPGPKPATAGDGRQRGKQGGSGAAAVGVAAAAAGVAAAAGAAGAAGPAGPTGAAADTARGGKRNGRKRQPKTAAAPAAAGDNGSAAAPPVAAG